MIVILKEARRARNRETRQRRRKQVFAAFKPAGICLVLVAAFTWYMLTSRWVTHSLFEVSLTIPDLGNIMIWSALVLSLVVFSVRGYKQLRRN